MHGQRGTLNMIVGADHISTNAVMITTLIEMAAGQNLLTKEKIPQRRAWLLSASQDQSELDRQVAVACSRLEISTGDLDGRLLAQSVAADRPRIAALNVSGHPVVNEATAQWLERGIAEKSIDVLALASLMDFHDLDHGEDFHMGAVGRVLRSVALRSDCAVVLGNHLTKKGEVSGAPALLYAMRTTSIIVPMKAVEADKLYVPARDCGRYLRAETKIGPVAFDDVWYRLDGDCDFVAVPWHPEKARRTVAPIAIVKTAARSSRSPAAGLPKIAKTSPTSPARATPDARKNRLNA